MNDRTPSSIVRRELYVTENEYFVKFNRVKFNGQTRLYKEIGYGDDYSGSIKPAGTPRHGVCP